MKTLGLFVGIFLGALSFAAAQSESTPAPTPAPPPVLTATNRIQRIFGPTAVVDGVLPEVKQRGSVFRRSDLNAPIVPGREYRNVSIHPRTGEPQGIILIAIRF